MKLSIIIPTLNEEKVLPETITQLRKLHSMDYEIIISDGLSTDNTLAIARELADIVVVHDGKKRQTIAEGRNLGAQSAHGEFLVFIDADVIIPDINKFFMKAIHCFNTDQKLKALTVFLKVLPEHARFLDKAFFAIVNRLYQVLNNVFHQGAASGEFQMYRKNTFDRLGGYNPKLVVGEDNELFHRISQVGRTKIATDLFVMHTSRRAHAVGWAHLLLLWLGNFIYSKLFKKSLSDEWTAVR